MGRELYRVPLDFNAPLGKTYEPETNPYLQYRKVCPKCNGDGGSDAFKTLADRWYGNAPFNPKQRGSEPYSLLTKSVYLRAKFNVERSPEFYGVGEESILRESKRLAELFNSRWAHHLNQDDVDVLVEAGRLKDLTHDFISGKGWVEKEPKVHITPDQVNQWSLEGMGHDAINMWVVCKAECSRLGKSHLCENCNGDGELWDDEKYKALSDEWRLPPVPQGDGYQMWSTTNDGPISPVFKKPEELAQWLTENRKNTIDRDISFDGWMTFINDVKWMPTLVTKA